MAYNTNAPINAGDLKTALIRTKQYVDTTVEKLNQNPVYIPSGSVSFANLPTAGAATLGNVYNITDAFTTTDSFAEGAGHVYTAGTNVAVIKDGETYKYDVFSGVTDYATDDEIDEMLDEVFGPVEST